MIVQIVLGYIWEDGLTGQTGWLRSAFETQLSVCPLTCLPCTKTLVILGARLSTSLVKRLAARRTTDLVGENTRRVLIS